MKWLPHFMWEYLNPGLLSLKRMVYEGKRNHRKNSFGPSKKVLVLAHSGGIGNAIEATPLVQAIRMLWPKCHLTFVPPAGDLFSDWCVPDRIITSPQEIKGERFDDTFAAYLYEEMHDWNNICDLGKVHAPKVWFNLWFLKNERDYYLDMLREYGFKGSAPPSFVSIKKPQMPPGDSDFRFCIAPCGKNEALWRHKKWPYYPELIQLLHNNYPNAQICIIGTKADQLPQAVSDTAEIADLRGLYSLSETAWLMKQSDFVIGNDCGPMHIADAVQAKGIVIFGPTCVIKNGPRNKIIPLVSTVKCSPCQYLDTMRKCSDYRCMKEIKAELVIEKIDEMLKAEHER